MVLTGVEFIAPGLMMAGVGTQIVARFGKWFTDRWFERIMNRPRVVLNKNYLHPHEWMLLVEFFHAHRPQTGDSVFSFPFTICNPDCPSQSERLVFNVPLDQFTINYQNIPMYVDPQHDTYGAIVAFEVWHMGKNGNKESRLNDLHNTLKFIYLIKGNERRFAPYFVAPQKEAKKYECKEEKHNEPEISISSMRHRKSTRDVPSHMSEVTMLMGAATADSLAHRRDAADVDGQDSNDSTSIVYANGHHTVLNVDI